MLRSVIVGAKRFLLLAIATAVFAAVNIAVSSNAYAANTKINATICSGNSSNASLSITSPASDSVVSTTPTDIAGTIGDITQIDITVDGQYNSTIPISAGQTTFLASLQLAEGTHTIHFVGNDVCQFQDPTATLVLTYHPVVPTNPTPAVTTTTTSTPSNDAAPSGDNVETSASSIANIPIIGSLAPVVNGIAKALDFDVTARQGGVVSAMLRFSFFVAGTGMAFFGAMMVRFLNNRALSSLATQVYAKGENLQDPQLSNHFVRNIRLARYSGMALLCLAFVV